MYFGPILRHVRVKLGVLFGNLRFCWAYIGPLRAYVRPYNIVGGLYVGLILAQVAILGHFKAMLGLSGVMCVKKTVFFLHGSSILEFLVLCCMQPLGCVMCKKHCKYREKIAFGAM